MKKQKNKQGIKASKLAKAENKLKKQAEQMITVKNAEGDPDTQAKILIQNKISYTPKVSVIIPVYNVEEYLRECLDSVVNQTLKEIEIICVDDGSTDNSLEILKEYAKKDNRISVLTQENFYAGIARNAGLAVAKGKFVAFLDSDDYYQFNDNLEVLYNKAMQYGVLICGGSFSFLCNGRVTQDNKKEYFGYNFEKDKIVNYNQWQFDYGYHRFIYERNLLVNNKIFFPSYKRFQDPPFFIKAMYEAKKFYALKRSTYLLRCGHKKVGWSKEKQEDLYEGLKFNLLFAKEHHLDRLYYLTAERIKQHMDILSNCSVDVLVQEKFNQLCLELNFDIIYKFNSSFTIKNYYPRKSIVASLSDVKPKISIIIPVYNVEKYLKECIESVIHQTLSDIEIITVDDGSKDSSGQILDEYAEKDSRIKVIHKSNSGYGASVNLGIEQARGEYIGIVEPDDYISLNMYECLYSKAVEFDVDFVKGDLYYWWSKSNTKKYTNCILDSKFYNKVVTELYRPELSPATVANWAGIYKRSFLNEHNVRHQETPGASYQDQGFYYRVIFNAKKAFYINQPFYYYRQDNEKSSVNSKSKIYSIFEEYEKIEQDLECLPNKEDFYQVVFRKKYNSCNWNYNRIVDDYKPLFYDRLCSDFYKNYVNGQVLRQNYTLEQWQNIRKWVADCKHQEIPKKKDNIEIPIVFSTDNKGVPYLATAVISALENKNYSSFYSFYVLCAQDVSIISKAKLWKITSNYCNAKMVFIDMENSFSHLKKMIAHIPTPTYYRLKMAESLPEKYLKAIYLDIDIVVLRDLSELYNIDLEDNYIAGVCAWGYYLNHIKGIDTEYYQKLGISDFKKYVNAGVTLWNLDKIRKDNLTSKLIEASYNNYKSQDQDVINVVFKDNIKILPMRFNLMTKYIVNTNDLSLVKLQKEVIDNINLPVIIHYADKVKPWVDKNICLSKYWWSYAQQNPYFRKQNNIISYLLFPYYLCKMPVLKRQYKQANIKHICLQLLSARVDIKNMGKELNSVEITAQNCKIHAPAWFANTQGIGQVIETNKKSQNITIKAIQDGKLVLSFRGQDKRFEGIRFPVWIDYKSIKIDGKEILSAPIATWHDKPFRYEKPVKDGQIVKVEVVQQYHQYSKDELKDVILKFNPNSDYIKEHINKLTNKIYNKIVKHESILSLLKNKLTLSKYKPISNQELLKSISRLNARIDKLEQENRVYQAQILEALKSLKK